MKLIEVIEPYDGDAAALAALPALLSHPSCVAARVLGRDGMRRPPDFRTRAQAFMTKGDGRVVDVPDHVLARCERGSAWAEVMER